MAGAQTPGPRRSTCSTATIAASSCPGLPDGCSTSGRRPRPDDNRSSRRGGLRSAQPAPGGPLRAGQRPRGRARRPLARRGRASTCSALKVRDGRLRPPPTRTRSRARGPRCAPAPPRAVLASASPATSSSTGAAPTTSAAAPHGSLHANGSLGSLIWCGTGPDSADAREQSSYATSSHDHEPLPGPSTCSIASAAATVRAVRGVSQRVIVRRVIALRHVRAQPEIDCSRAHAIAPRARRHSPRR